MYKDIGHETSPTEFLDKCNCREKKRAPRDYTEGVLPRVYAAPEEYAAEQEYNKKEIPATSQQQERKPMRFSQEDEEDEFVLATKKEVEMLKDKSLKGTKAFLKEWKRKHGVRSRPSTSGNTRRKYRD